MLIGAHVSTAGGLPNAIERAEERRCEAIQIFNQSPRMWRPTRYSDADFAAFREALARSPVELVAIHMIYLINPAAKDAAAPGADHAAGPLARAMFKLSLPGAVQQIVAEPSSGPAGFPVPGPLAGKTAIGGQPTAYACLGPQCSLPVTDGDALLEVLRGQRVAPST